MNPNREDNEPNNEMSDEMPETKIRDTDSLGHTSSNGHVPGGFPAATPGPEVSAQRVVSPLAGSAEPAPERPAKRVVARGANLYYGNFHAVEDVSMEIEPNKVTALIGSSGCGKTTFLRSLNRMHELTPGARVEGSIEIDGQDIYADDVDPVAVRRAVGMVFQAPNPFPTMSIYENVAAGVTLNQRKIKRARKDEIVEKALRGAHLWEEVKDRLDKPGIGLSGGQQQRLCIARATAVEPEVLLMDEPCSALDPIATLAIEELIGELKRRFTIVIVTHNMQQAARASDVTAFFNLEQSGRPGRLIEMGPAEKMFTNPDDPATEAYVSGRFG